MSRIEDAIDGLDSRMKEFLQLEGFSFKNFLGGRYWHYKTSDSKNRIIEVSIYPANISLVIYKADGSGDVEVKKDFPFDGFVEFEAAYELLLKELRP